MFPLKNKKKLPAQQSISQADILKRVALKEIMFHFHFTDKRKGGKGRNDGGREGKKFKRLRVKRDARREP